METERYFSGEIDVVLIDGSCLPAKVTADELWGGGKEIYRVSFQQDTEVRVAEAEEDFLEALKRLRLDLEKTGALLYALVPARMFIPLGCRDPWVQRF
jgi:hypothetical protein